MEEFEVDIDYFVKVMCKEYKLNIFQRVAISNADYGDKYQCMYIIKELEKLGVDNLAISGFIHIMREKQLKNK